MGLKNKNKIFMAKRVIVEAYIKKNQYCMDHPHDVDSYVKYLRGLDKIVKNPAINEYVNFIDSKEGRDNFPQIVKALTETEDGLLQENAGAIAMAALLAGWKGVQVATKWLAQPVVAAKRLAGASGATARHISVHSKNLSKARDALKNMANAKNRYRFDSFGVRKNNFMHSQFRERQRQVAQQGLTHGREEAIKSFERLNPGHRWAGGSGASTAQKYSELKNLGSARTYRGHQARLARAQGHQAALRHYKTHGPKLRDAFHGGMMAPAGWATAGALSGAGLYPGLAFGGAVAYFMLDKCKDPSRRFGEKWYQWTSACCEDDNWEEFIKTKNPKLLAKDCLDQIMKHCGEMVMPWCDPEAQGARPEGWDPKNCKDCLRIMSQITTNAPGGKVLQPSAAASQSGTGGPVGDTVSGVGTSLAADPSVRKVMTGKRHLRGCIAANSIYSSANEVAEDLLCVYQKEGENISKEVVAKAICNTNYIKKLQQDINRLLGASIPVTGRIDKDTAPMIKKLVRRVRPQCVGVDYLGQKQGKDDFV